MDMFQQLLMLVLLAISLIVYFSMFGSVVTAITGAVTNWSSVSGSNLSWLPPILIILSAIMPLLALVLLIWSQFKGKHK